MLILSWESWLVLVAILTIAMLLKLFIEAVKPE